MKRPAISRNLLIALVLIQSLLLTIICVRTTGGWDEWAHLPSGLYNLKYNDPYAYRVNPPLVRLIAALPVSLLGGELRQPQVPRGDPGMRIEWALMKAYVAEQGPRVFDWLTIARFSVLPISILGSLLIHSIAKHFSGPRTALLAATLFVFSPMMLTCGASIAPDLGATVFGLFASWRSYVWLQTGRWNHAIWSGIAIGTALGSKTTWILFPVLLAVFFARRLCSQRGRRAIGRWIGQIFLVASISTAVLGAMYDFQGMFRPLGSYDFISNSLTGIEANSSNAYGPQVGNRFRGTWLALIHLPLPFDYVKGIDVQKRDFEGVFDSYLLGEWQDHGWWYYYAIAWFVKEPIATWVLMLVGWAGLAKAIRSSNRRRRLSIKSRGLMLVCAPGIIVFFFVSSQVGFNHHLRYVLPAFPAAYLIASYPLGRVSKPVQCVMMGLTFWFCVSSVSLLPRSYGFFSEAIGGWRNGHKYLNSSNLDWGQDLLTIRNWVTENSEKRPVYILHPIPQLSLDDLKIDASGGHGLVGRNGPSAPGWWLVSIDQCLAKPYSWFLEQTPTERLSVSTTVYHVVDGQIVTAESSDAYEAAQ